ncbi:sensor histidine kinase [Brevibacterium yomogidense]|uniref:sensor histidine kinase n=1 Tax=Brevibacterium yomogidense TaxID=946573 RepID=UPI002FCD0D1F
MNSETPATALTAVGQRMRGHDRRRALRIALDIVIGLLVYVSGVLVGSLSLIGVPGAMDESGELSGVGAIVFLLVWMLWLTVFVRTRWPLVPLIAGAVCGLMGGDVLLLLVGVFHAVVRLPRRPATAATATGAAVVVWAVVRACVREPGYNPFAFLVAPEGVALTGPDAHVFSPQTALAIDVLTIVSGAVALGIAVGVGYLVRRTRRMRSVEAVAAHQTERSEALTVQLARQSERQMLARELHDTLSHRLSVISLQSGALEVSRDDARAAEAAAAVRKEAKASLEDLRDLVSGVRDGTAGATRTVLTDTTPALATLRTVPDLIASVRSTGPDVTAIIVLEDVDRAPALLSRTVYRIVQESLTNAMKHAPGRPITVDLRVSAEHGARIFVSNPSVPEQEALGDLTGSGGGMGLIGIEERVRMVSGEVSIGPRGDSFVVDVRLPPFTERAGHV